MYSYIPDYINPDYVAEMTYKERYEDDATVEESTFVQPRAVYDPD